MNKIVTDIPNTAEKIVIHVFDQEDFDLGQTTFDIRTLQNAPQKRVIELPAESLGQLEEVKKSYVQNEFGHVGTFLNKAVDVVNGWQYGHLKVSFDENDLADWYSHPEFVEFTPKKEPLFKVLVELHEGDLWVTKNRTHDIDDEEISFSQFDNDHDTRGRYKFTEEEADELVNGLAALNARKVKVEE